MSATILYQAVDGTSLDVGAPSNFMMLLKRWRGDLPLDLTPGDAHELAILAAGTENENYAAALIELADTIDKCGRVRVWAEY